MNPITPISQVPEFKEAFEHLHRLHARRKALADRLAAGISPEAVRRRREQAASAMLVGGGSRTAVVEQAIDWRAVQEELETVTAAIPQQEEIVRRIRVKLAYPVSAALVPARNELLSQAREKTKALAKVLAELKAVYDAPEAAGYEADVVLEPINLSTGVYDLMIDPQYPDSASRFARFIQRIDETLSQKAKK